MNKNKGKKLQEESEKKNEKSAGDNQWTSNNLKYYPDERERQDGPGGN